MIKIQDVEPGDIIEVIRPNPNSLTDNMLKVYISSRNSKRYFVIKLIESFYNRYNGKHLLRIKLLVYINRKGGGVTHIFLDRSRRSMFSLIKGNKEHKEEANLIYWKYLSYKRSPYCNCYKKCVRRYGQGLIQCSCDEGLKPSVFI